MRGMWFTGRHPPCHLQKCQDLLRAAFKRRTIGLPLRSALGSHQILAVPQRIKSTQRTEVHFSIHLQGPTATLANQPSSRRVLISTKAKGHVAASPRPKALIPIVLTERLVKFGPQLWLLRRLAKLLTVDKTRRFSRTRLLEVITRWVSAVMVCSAEPSGGTGAQHCGCLQRQMGCYYRSAARAAVAET